MLKYKSEINMFGVKFSPIYRKKKFTAINTAKIEIKKAQKIHHSYNVPAKITIYEKANNNEWKKIEEIDVSPL